MKYNPNIHHRKSIRLKGYDYAQEGLYFITICTQNKACLFGSVVDGEMILNEFGMIVYKEWMNTTELRKNINLGEFIVMPNHIHGIIEITRRVELHSTNLSTGEFNSPQRTETETGDLITGEFDSPQRTETETGDLITGEFDSPQPPKNKLQSPSQTVGAIVRGFKSAVTKQLNLLNIGTQVWQRNYYENIIRDERAHSNISQYIVSNPSKWKEDKFFL